MVVLFSFYNCDDFIDSDNKSDVTSDEYFNTEDGFEALVNYSYALLKPLYNEEPTMQCSGTDLYTAGRNSMPSEGLHNYTDLNPENSDVSDFYSNCYIDIQAANCALYYASTVDADEDLVTLRSQEVRFLRAYCYFELVQHFGGVAIEDEYVNTIITSAPRNTLAETYDFIISEMEDVVGSSSLLPDTDLDGRVNKAAVYHYLAKVYLTAAWDLDNSEYFTTAASYAEKAIALVGTGLDETYEELWDPSKDNTHNEVVFALQYDRTSSEAAGISESKNGNGLQTYFASYYGGAENLYKAGSSNFCASEHLMYLYEEGDTRYDGTFMTMMYNTVADDNQYYGDYYAPYNGTTGDDYISFYYPAHYVFGEGSQDVSDEAEIERAAAIEAWRGDDVQRANTVVIPMSSNTYFVTGGSTDIYTAAQTDVFGYPCIKKFDDPDATYGNNTDYRDIVLARLGETYLIAAEAYLKAGNQSSADEMLNVVRERAFRGSGITDYEKSNVTIDDILDERALELAGERLRWCDLRRTQTLIDYNVNYNPAVTSSDAFVGSDGEEKWYRPIPQDAIDLNSAEIEQNPGY